MRHFKAARLAVSLLIGIAIMTSGMMVFADDNGLMDHMKSATLARHDKSSAAAVHKHGGFKAAIDKLVEEGRLSKEKAEQIHSFIKQKRAEQKQLNKDEQQKVRKGYKYGMLKDLVEAKIITENEAELIKSKLREIREQAFNEKLNELTKQGIITQAQADKVKVYFEKARQERQERFKALENMNDAQRKAFFKEHKKNSPLNKLVEDGVITQDEADKIREALKKGHKGDCDKH